MAGGGHTNFFSASSAFLLAFLGLGWGVIAVYKGTQRIEVDDEGIRFFQWFKDVKDIPWDTFLGITYHGVTTRLGRPATIYSITGDAGICSFVVMGLPPNTSTREMEMGAFLLLHASKEQHEQMLAQIKSQTDQEPEPERAW